MRNSPSFCLPVTFAISASIKLAKKKKQTKACPLVVDSRGRRARLTLTPDAEDDDDDDDDDCQLGEAFRDSGIRASERLFMLGALEWIVVERMQR